MKTFIIIIIITIGFFAGAILYRQHGERLTKEESQIKILIEKEIEKRKKEIWETIRKMEEERKEEIFKQAAKARMEAEDKFKFLGKEFTIKDLKDLFNLPPMEKKQETGVPKQLVDDYLANEAKLVALGERLNNCISRLIERINMDIETRARFLKTVEIVEMINSDIGEALGLSIILRKNVTLYTEKVPIILVYAIIKNSSILLHYYKKYNETFSEVKDFLIKISINDYQELIQINKDLLSQIKKYNEQRNQIFEKLLPYIS